MRLATIAMFLVITGCHSEADHRAATATRLPDSAPFKYRGVTLRFPEGSVASRFEEGAHSDPWARLIPDAPVSRDMIDARYLIDLGRSSTGKKGAAGYSLGWNSYQTDASRTNLDGGYIMYCRSPEHELAAFDCAVLLNTLPLAAVEFRDRPRSASEAEELVNDAEAYLVKAKKSA